MLPPRWMSVILELKCERFDYRRGNWLSCGRPLQGEVITLVHEQWQRERGGHVLDSVKNKKIQIHTLWWHLACFARKETIPLILWHLHVTIIREGDKGRSLSCVHRADGKVCAVKDGWRAAEVSLWFRFCWLWLLTSKVIACQQVAELNADPIKIASREHLFWLNRPDLIEVVIRVQGNDTSDCFTWCPSRNAAMMPLYNHFLLKENGFLGRSFHRKCNEMKQLHI